ncbi:MAG: glycosyltransferase family 39 protein [Chloroflexota bacterium]
MDNTARSTASILLAGGGLVLFNGFRILNAQGYVDITVPILIILGGALVLFLGIMIATEKISIQSFRLLERVSAALRIRQDQFVMLVMSIILAVMAQTAAGYDGRMLSAYMALFAWVAAIFLVVAGSWKAGEAGKYEGDPRPLYRYEVLLSMAGIFILAFFLRIVQPETIPIILTGDEGSAGIVARYFAEDQINNIFRVEWYGFPSFYFAISGIFVRLLGPTLTALRISSAIAGALTVVAVFGVVRAAFGKRAGWFAAIFLATLHFHVHFSRIALNNIWDGFWLTVGAGALWYGWQRERRNAYILAGLSMGLAQYFYTSGRTLPLIAIIWLIILGLRDRPKFKRSLPDLGLMVVTAVVVCLPLFIFFARYPLDMLAPMQRVSILGNDWLAFNEQTRNLPAWRLLLDQFWLGFGAYVFVPSHAWYTPDIPILRPIAAVFFVIGLLLSLLHPNRKFGLLLLIWILIFALMGALSESTPAAQRYPAAAPAAAILVAIGLYQLTALFERLWPSARRWVNAGAVVALLALAAREVQFYFFEYTPRSAIFMAQDNSMVGFRLGQFLRTRPPGAQIVFLGMNRMGFYSIPSTQYLAPQFSGIDINFPWRDPQNPLPDKEHLIFIILPHLQSEIPLVQEDYLGGQLSQISANDGAVLFYIYEYNPKNLP